MKIPRIRWLVAFVLFYAGSGLLDAEQGPATDLRAQHALGVQRVLVLAVSFPDVSAAPASLARVRQRMLNEPADYYATQSQRKTRLQGEVKGWYKLPANLAEYKVAPENTKIDRQRVRRLVDDAFNAAEKDVRFDHYDHVIIVVGVHTSAGMGYGSPCYSANPGTLNLGGSRYGRAQMVTVVTRGGQRFSGGIVVMAQNAPLGHVVHDLAHALGGVVHGRRAVPDLYDTVLQSNIGPLSLSAAPKFTVFMGSWDLMSRHFITPQRPPPGMSSFTRLRMGWIDREQVLEVAPGESQAITLAPLARGTGTLAIKVLGRSGLYTLLENRQAGPGDPVLPGTGLLVLGVDESEEDGNGIVRVLDADPTVPNFEAAAFGIGPGQKPSVRLSRDVAIEVLWQRGADLTVMVTTAASGPEVQAVASRIRGIARVLQRLPESPGRVAASADLAAAMDLLTQLKLAEAIIRLDAIALP